MLSRSNFRLRKWCLFKFPKPQFLVRIFDAADHKISRLRRLLLCRRFIYGTHDTRSGSAVHRCIIQPDRGSNPSWSYNFSSLQSRGPAGLSGMTMKYDTWVHTTFFQQTIWIPWFFEKAEISDTIIILVMVLCCIVVPNKNKLTERGVDNDIPLWEGLERVKKSFFYSRQL